MIYLVDFETAKTLSYITLAIIVIIPIVIYLVYLNGIKKGKRIPDSVGYLLILSQLFNC